MQTLPAKTIKYIEKLSNNKNVQKWILGNLFDGIEIGTDFFESTIEKLPNNLNKMFHGTNYPQKWFDTYEKDILDAPDYDKYAISFYSASVPMLVQKVRDIIISKL